MVTLTRYGGVVETDLLGRSESYALESRQEINVNLPFIEMHCKPGCAVPTLHLHSIRPLSSGHQLWKTDDTASVARCPR